MIARLHGAEKHRHLSPCHHHHHHHHHHSSPHAPRPRRRHLAVILVRRLPGSCPPCTGAGIGQPGAQKVNGGFRLRAGQEHQKMSKQSPPLDLRIQHRDVFQETYFNETGLGDAKCPITELHTHHTKWALGKTWTVTC